MSQAANRANILRLYKDILSSAKRFPSIKKFKIIDEIKVGFKQYKSSTDDNEIQARINLAVDGLSKLSMYSNLSHSSRSWVVNMDKQPMPKKEEKVKDNINNATDTDDNTVTSSISTTKVDDPKL